MKMKRIIIIFAVMVTMINIFPAINVFAEDVGIKDEIVKQLDDIISGSGIEADSTELESISFFDLSEMIINIIKEKINMPVKLLGVIIFMTIITVLVNESGLNSVNGQNADISSMICVISAVVLIIPYISSVYENSEKALEYSGGFISVFVPLFSGIVIACGGITSGGLYNLAIVGASELFFQLSKSLLIPILGAMAVLGITGSIFPNNSISSLVGLIKRITVWLITVSMTFFTALTTLKCTVAGKADGIATKTVKFIVSGAVPIVGGAVSDAYSTVKGSFELLSETLGMTGITAFILIAIPPIAEIMIYRFVMWIGEAVAELFSAVPIVSLLRSLDCGLSVALCTLICYAVMFMVCSAIMIQGIG